MKSEQLAVSLCLSFLSLAVLCITSGCCPPCCHPIGSLPAEYQAVLDGTVRDSGVPGGVMGVFCDDFWAVGASGVASLENQTPMTPDMQIRLASMTKTFTAALTLKLVDEGLIGFEDTLEDWFPGEFEYGDEVKVKMLLNHTSGVHDHEEMPDLMNSIVTTPERVWTQEEIMDMIASNPLDFIPGTSYYYTNAEYYVLGVIIERASGMTFQEALMDRIFKHADITRTEVLDGKVNAPAADFYSLLDNQTEVSNLTNWNYSWDWTAGAGVSTASDMIRFLNTLFGPCLLSKELREEMMTAQAPSISYGYGMSVETYKGKVVVSHGGANFGNYGVWICIPEIHAGFFIAFNRLDMTPDIANQMQTLTRQMKDMLLAQAGEL